MPLSNAQLKKLKDAYELIGSIMIEEGGGITAYEQPQWLNEEEKKWRLLKAVDLRDGDIGEQEWTHLGATHGYKPQGLGGFFSGAKPAMASQGARRVLTDAGKMFVNRWENDFGPYEA